MNHNTKVYCKALFDCITSPCEPNIHDIVYETCGSMLIFEPEGLIAGVSESYIKHELDWYDSQDLNINGHNGIENNRVWLSCATNSGNVNSNYGWCIYSKENCEQFNNAVIALCADNSTKQAIMCYTRPSIHEEWNDNIHANHDMICTCYTSSLLRNGLLEHHVHMRSNDIWYGLRNDLAWQQEVLRRLVKALNDNGVTCKAGNIKWFTDSLHLYERNIELAKSYLTQYEF